MRTIKFAAIAAACALFSVAGCMSSSGDMGNGMGMNHSAMSASDHQMMQSCMAMSSSDRMSNSQCMAMMHQMNMSEADMAMMNSCKGMSHDAMMANADCMRLMREHPGAMDM